MEVGGYLYVAIQPADAPPALAMDRVLAGLQRVNLDDGHIYSPLISKLWRSSDIQFQMH